MTPADVISVANQRYNSVGDTFFPDSEAYYVMYQGSMELAVKAYVIEDSLNTTTVSGTQGYAYPTNMLAIKRVTYNGARLSVIDARQDDTISLYNDASTTTGTPGFYWEWESEIKLRPIPDAAQTLKVFGYVRPQVITSSSSSLEIPTEYHMSLVNLLLSEKSAKNKNYDGASYYRALWDADVALAVSRMQKKRRANAFRIVTDVEQLPPTFIGTI